MKKVCIHNGCGTVLDMPGTGADTEERLNALMERHLNDCHSSFEELARPLLTRLRDKLALLAANGDRFTPGTARDFFTAIESLLTGKSVIVPALTVSELEQGVPVEKRIAILTQDIEALPIAEVGSTILPTDRLVSQDAVLLQIAAKFSLDFKDNLPSDEMK